MKKLNKEVLLKMLWAFILILLMCVFIVNHENEIEKHARKDELNKSLSMLIRLDSRLSQYITPNQSVIDSLKGVNQAIQQIGDSISKQYDEIK
jgi:hypothetical protein